MNTARIVVLTTADGAGAIVANRSDNRPLPTEPAAQLPAVEALTATGEPIRANGAGLMAAVSPTSMRVPSLTPTLK